MCEFCNEEIINSERFFLSSLGFAELSFEGHTPAQLFVQMGMNSRDKAFLKVDLAVKNALTAGIKRKISYCPMCGRNLNQDSAQNANVSDEVASDEICSCKD